MMATNPTRVSEDRLTARLLYLTEDEARVGTAGYKGHAYFWAHEYRHYMRGFYQTFGTTERRSYEILKQMRRGVHRDFLRLSLDLEGESHRHETIIQYHHLIADTKLKAAGR